ncbi:GreA/GreB family elongation factor [Leeuwenhoekiella sp. A16]|uniref:GreA/GreB family elongation factor n=1 Tax=unclassified Leeuwenhoekiella TaxID=2615029 RepID=UPI003A801C6A|tara:strand:- start:246 stop:665 length:420 start_codon:yes stop_codon:yes gene_type:complete
MKYGSLIIEKKEYVYLKRILNISGYAEDLETRKSVERLFEELKSAMIVDEVDMPEDVVRFNSSVTVSSNKGWKKSLQLVIPLEKDFKQDKISILTPMGAALLGYSEEDTFEWEFPNGRQELKIEVVKQDENQKRIEVPI